MFLNEKQSLWEHRVIREGEDNILRINCETLTDVPLIENNALVMSKTMEKLIQVKDATKIVFYQKRDYEYDYEQVKILKEVAFLFNKFAKSKEAFSFQAFAEGGCQKGAQEIFNFVQDVIFNTLKSDPVGAYVRLKRKIRLLKIDFDKTVVLRDKKCVKKRIDILNSILTKLDKTSMIIFLKPYMDGYKIGDRAIYKQIFHPNIKPDFMFTRLMASVPENAEEIDSYVIGNNTEVTVFNLNGDVKTLYHIMPPEFKLTEAKYEILDQARKILAEHKPTKEEFVDPERMRDVFSNVGQDLIEELIKVKGMKLTEDEIKELTEILIRYTIGFGLIEILLSDEQIQDIAVNSPMGRTPMFIVHGKHGDCFTNIIPTKPESESWASKLRMISGRPLDEADPILDTELIFPNVRTRVATITEPLNPNGLAFSFRRHRNKPWTLPLFIKNGMLNPLGAGLLSFLIDGTRTLLVAGTRSSGKTSLLGSFLIEIMRRYRIITIEDTLELPTDGLRNLGYNIQPMKVSSALALKKESEVSATDGIRSTLRLGDSSLIVGEVRSKEAIALYEAMRVGAAANVVAGTIHGDSPYGVFDRVVNDIGIPKTSFKATDIIVVAKPIKSADGLHSFRRVLSITEVRKKWENDPMIENGFVDLMRYNPGTDQLEPTDELLNGESEVLKIIAGEIKEFTGDWDAVWSNITLRAKIKEALVKYSEKESDPELLEAPFVIKSNDVYHIVSENVKEEKGKLDSKKIFSEWELWLKREIKKRRLEKAKNK